MGDPASLASILWSSDPTTLRSIWMVLTAVLASVVVIHIPLIFKLTQLFLLERKLVRLSGRDRKSPANSDALREAFRNSPVAATFAEFEGRWSAAQLSESQERAPIRLIDVLEDRPLLPYGPRRSMLPTLPALFLGLGVFAALIGLIPSMSSLAAEEAGPDAQSVWMAGQLALVLRATAWGFLCAIGASMTGRLIEGGFHARSVGLDKQVERAFGPVTPGELAELTRQTQQPSLNALGKALAQFANESNERLDRGLQRIEQSTSRAASIVSQEQRDALHTVVHELSISVRQGVEHHLAELYEALQLATEQQVSVNVELAETFERMIENSQTQDRVARALVESASAVEEAVRAMHTSSVEMTPALEHLRRTSSALSDTADRMTGTQQVVARTAEGLRRSFVGIADFETRAEDISRAISEFTDHTRQIDKTMESLRKEIHDESRRLQGSGNELGRRLTQATEALETTTAEASQRARNSSSARSPAREPSWSPAPSGNPGVGDRGTTDRTTNERNGRNPSDDSQSARETRSRFDRPPRERDPAAPQKPAPDAATPAADSDSSTGQDLPNLGYRLGEPKAKGPDPYARFSAPEDSPPNLRRFPTRDRELGDELKLSGLLGPSGGSDAPADGADGPPKLPKSPKSPESNKSPEDEN